MGVRETLNQRRGVVIACVAVIVLIALGVVFWPSRESPEKRPGVPLDWYTIDDGKSWFKFDARLFPPFDYNGKTAYRCRVWTCDDGKTKFVSHLERYAAPAKKKLEGMTRQQQLDSLEIQMIEVKPPGTGDRGWIDHRDAKASAIITPTCPPGGNPDALRPVAAE
jgi:hypothetical protein